MARPMLSIEAALAIAVETGQPVPVVDRPNDSRFWRVLACNPDGTTTVVEDRLTSLDKAVTACNLWSLRSS